MKKESNLKYILNGIWTENPLLVLVLGTCPTLAVTTSAINGLGMGLSTTAVLIMSNIMVSLLRNIIPDRVRLPAEIVIVASFVTICDMLMAGFTPSLYESLGIYIPLIVVNCIILGRAESFALKHDPLASACDGLGMGIGFTLALVFIGAIREILGSGSVFGWKFLPESIQPISIFVLAPGAFLVYAFLTALQNKLKMPRKGCLGDCSKCPGHDIATGEEVTQ